MIEIEQRALGALEQHVGAGDDLVGHEAAGVADVGAQALPGGDRVVDPLIDLGGGGRDAAEVHDHRHQLVEVGRHQLAQALAAEQIADAHAAATGLGLVGRADAAPGGADGALATLAHLLDALVVRQDHVGVLPDQQLAAREEPTPGQLGDLVEQRVRIDHHAVAEHARLAGVTHPGRHQMRHELLPVDDQRVPGVGTAAETHDGVGGLGVQVHHLALALVAPLGADHDHDGHRRLLGCTAENMTITAPPRSRR